MFRNTEELSKERIPVFLCLIPHMLDYSELSTTILSFTVILWNIPQYYGIFRNIIL